VEGIHGVAGMTRCTCRAACFRVERTVALKVLIADDSQVVHMCFRWLLDEATDIELVGPARDASGTVDAVRRLKPEVVVLNVHMSGGYGLQVLKTIKQGESPAPIVIALYSFSTGRVQHECRRAGAECLFDKARDLEKVVGVLKRLTHEDKRSVRAALDLAGLNIA
jgi:DNA-binding NarL/FixJ family response regulator